MFTRTNRSFGSARIRGRMNPLTSTSSNLPSLYKPPDSGQGNLRNLSGVEDPRRGRLVPTPRAPVAALPYAQKTAGTYAVTKRALSPSKGLLVDIYV